MTTAQALTKERCNVGGMTCSTHAEKAVSKVNGVAKAEVNLLTNSMTVEYNSDICGKNDIIHAVEQSGYTASLPPRKNPKNAVKALPSCASVNFKPCAAALSGR